MRTLKVRCNGKGMYPNLELLALKPPVRKFVGWDMKIVNIDGEDRHQLVAKSEPEVVKYHTAYRKAVRSGDLLPADKETAALCGIPFNK